MALVDDLIRDEGLKLFPYKDTLGHLTIGIGINLDAGITEQEARMLCEARCATISQRLTQALPWIYNISPNRYDALMNMAYNLGISGLLGFHAMLHALETQDWETAAAEALNSRWATQVGDRAKRIAAAFRNG